MTPTPDCLPAIRGGGERSFCGEAPQGRPGKSVVSTLVLRQALPSAYTLAAGGRKRGAWGYLKERQHTIVYPLDTSHFSMYDMY